MSACVRPGIPAPESAFRVLRRAAAATAEPLPSGSLHFTVRVLDVGAAADGAWIEVADPGNRDERLVLIYGHRIDAEYGSYFKDRLLEMSCKVAGRTRLPDGRVALCIDVAGMSVSTQPAPGTTR